MSTAVPVNNESLSNLFGIDFSELEQDKPAQSKPVATNGSEDPCSEPVSASFSSDKERSDFVDKKLKDLLDSASSILNSAQTIISMSKDGDSIEGMSSLINSVAGVISEINRTSVMRERFEFQKELERIRSEERLKLAEFKAKHDPRLQIKGNLVQNNLIQFNQESIVRSILKEQNLIGQGQTPKESSSAEPSTVTVDV